MNNIFKSLLAFSVLAFTTAGCTDLNVDINSEYTEYPTSQMAQEAKLATIYYSMRGSWCWNYFFTQSLTTDEEVGVSFDGDWVDGHKYSRCSLHSYTPDDGSLSWYSDCASGITKCNQVLEDLNSVEGSDVAVAKARVMRAFYHFLLMDSFGDVPIMDHKPADNEQIDRSKRADVAKFIETELLEAMPELPAESDASTYGKPNKWMAMALLVKLYMNWPVYTCADVASYDAATASNEKLNSAVAYCDSIIASGLFNLSDSYRSKFMPDNGSQIKDFIYAIPYDCITQEGNHLGRLFTWRKANGGGEDGKTSYYNEKSGLSYGGFCNFSPEFSDLFNLANDDRLDAVLHEDYIPLFDASTKEPSGQLWTYHGNTVPLYKTITLKTQDEDLNVGNNEFGWSQGWKSIKFWVIGSDYVNNRNQSNDVPVFRYADILLEKAEAIKRGATATRGDTPQSLLNQIRSYVHAETIDHDPSLQEILDERGRELFNENWRRNDLIRFGKYEGEWGFHKQGFPTANFDKNRRIFPIPRSVMNENTNWEQNPGY